MNTVHADNVSQNAANAAEGPRFVHCQFFFLGCGKVWTGCSTSRVSVVNKKLTMF